MQMCYRFGCTMHLHGSFEACLSEVVKSDSLMPCLLQAGKEQRHARVQLFATGIKTTIQLTADCQFQSYRYNGRRQRTRTQGM